MDKSEKSKEDVRAEREARKSSKLAAKNKAKLKKKESSIDENVALKGYIQTNIPNIVNKKEYNVYTNTIFDKNEEIIVNEKNKLDSSNCSRGKITATDTSKVEKENDSVKSKAQLKAERRAVQEAQRAKKALQKTQKDESKVSKQIKENASKSIGGDNLTVAVISVKTEIVNKVVPIKDPLASIHKVKLFSHLYKKSDIHHISDILTCNKNVHPAIIKLGLQYQENIIIGSNARCVALLNALKQMICDYKTPTDKDFSRGFENELSAAAVYLDHCRPLSVSMTNALKHLKWHLMKLPNTISDSDGQNRLQEIIDTYVKEQIETARKAICITAQQKILDNDVILTYGFSSLIEHILNESHQNGKKFKVIIVDSGPLFEGKELLRRLVKKRIQCTYVLLSAVSYIMKEATKVFLGAHALLTNGYVMSRAGASQVALLAHSYNVPVLVCCETHKFSDRVQTDAFVYNELGDPEMVIKKELWQSNHYLTPLSLLYDVTPPDLVTAVITEIAILPCTSAPVVLRVKPTESILL